MGSTHYLPKLWVLALSVVDNSISPSETLKKGGLERLAAQWGV